MAVSSAEIFRRAQLVGKADFKNLEAYVVAAGLYWALTAVFTSFQSRLEKKLSAGYVRTTDPRTPPRFAVPTQTGLDQVGDGT